MSDDTIFALDYPVNTLVLNSHKRLGMHGLLTMLGDVAWLHAERLGCGFEAMGERGTIWVLTRQSLRMDAWPRWGETVTIRTWPCPFDRALAPRQFEILVGDRKLGECVTLWLVMDSQTRRPMRVGAATQVFTARSEGLLDFEAEKIQPRQGLTQLAQFAVRNSDIDVNGHVGNSRYAQWVLDAVPHAIHAHFEIASYAVNFLAETHIDDEIVIDGGDIGSQVWQFQGLRKVDGKAAFTARLAFRPREAQA